MGRATCHENRPMSRKKRTSRVDGLLNSSAVNHRGQSDENKEENNGASHFHPKGVIKEKTATIMFVRKGCGIFIFIFAPTLYLATSSNLSVGIFSLLLWGWCSARVTRLQELGSALFATSLNMYADRGRDGDRGRSRRSERSYRSPTPPLWINLAFRRSPSRSPSPTDYKRRKTAPAPQRGPDTRPLEEVNRELEYKEELVSSSL